MAVASGKRSFTREVKKVFGIIWRSIVVALGYLVGIIAAGMIGGMLGWQPPEAGSSGSSSILIMLFSVILLGVFIGPIAARLKISHLQQFFLWWSLILFNLGSVALEGAYFAPDLVKIPLAMLMFQQLLATAGAALALTFLFAPAGVSFSWIKAFQARPWHAWLWRFVVSAASYVVFYWVFGGINYNLVTKPYYETHAGGLTVPAPQVVLVLETVRGLLIVFSVLLLMLSMRGTRKERILTTGWLLFAIGGIIPLCWQATTLPLMLLLSSAVEIFFQNFSTGAVSAWLLGIENDTQR
jgi:hypothetical protein